MVPDGYYYALPLVGAGIFIGWLTSPLWGVPALLLAFFFLWFFRDPERTISDVKYQKGKFMNAMNAASADQNEHNTVTVQGDGSSVVFKQIAGLLARRIVFDRNIGDRVERGERIGLIKFGSRVDVLLDSDAKVQIKVGDHVKGGSSVLAYLHPKELATAGAVREQQGA